MIVISSDVFTLAVPTNEQKAKTATKHCYLAALCEYTDQHPNFKKSLIKEMNVGLLSQISVMQFLLIGAVLLIVYFKWDGSK